MKLKKIFAGMAASAIAMTAFAMSTSAVDAAENEKVTDKFNLILITTDIPCEVNDNDEAVVDGSVVTCKDVTLKMAGNEYQLAVAPQKSDAKYLTFQLINTYNNKLDTFDYTIPGEGDTMEIDFTIEGLGGTTGNAGIAFQTNETWNFRNCYGDASPATFPNATVGVQGAGYGFDTAVDCKDTEVNGDGTYSISIATSGVINSEIQKFDDGTERSGDALKWAMNKSYEPQAADTSSSNAGKDNSSSNAGKDNSSSTAGKDSSSKSSSTSSKAGTTGTQKGTTSTSAAATSSKASDNTNASTGASAGIALAGLALAGAAIVVAKRK